MFITLEGSEGSGKTTQAPLLAEFLRARGYAVLATREPGGTLIGDQVRAILSDFKNSDMQPRTEILLFQASRAQLVETVIRPHLARGGVVVSDRYADSTVAYQGYGYQVVAPEQMRAVIDFATGGLKPDLTLLLDVDVEVGLRRRGQAGGMNRLDTYDVEFYRRVRQGYFEMVHAEPGRWVVIDATQPPDMVQAAMRQVVLERLKAGKVAD
jgi:dTMP kinase